MNKIYYALSVCLCAASPISAGIVYTYDADNPITQAGRLPATSLDLTSSLPSTIFGNFGPDENAVNVFEIDIREALNFSSITLPVLHGAPDTELFLFDQSGHAVYANDDISGGNTLSCLPSSGLGNVCPFPADGLGPPTAGIYFLAIARSANSPLDIASNYLFSSASNVYSPNPLAGSVADWDNAAFINPNFDNSYYQINLTGTVPEPSTWILLLGATAVLGFCKTRGIFGS